MQRSVCKLVRRLLRGQATNDLNGHKSTLTNVQVSSLIGLAPIHAELIVLRIRWFAQIVSGPNHHTQYIAAMFGDMINVDNDVPNKNHPRFQQLVNGFNMLEFDDELAQNMTSSMIR